MGFIQTLFYITGIIFFVIVIIAAFIFMRKTMQTANAIKKLVTSEEIEDIIMQIKNRVEPILRAQ